ncbi:Uma2 family endonuclease [Streptomyces xiaopingdaonensis]|uniref:Uma2 family endonuclease n=1 Tax=Streptomyces xiaopingdaonensis TaxID=1565415 RepID=UPI001ED95A1C|nr:Uma2 family endonuclease [Streptomyces xiaopingdaonensis]
MGTEGRADAWQPPQGGWTLDQVRQLEPSFDWELAGGAILPRRMTDQWHDQVRDGLHVALATAALPPYSAGVARCVHLDDRNVIKPDVIVFTTAGLDLDTLEFVPATHVALVVEVVSPGSRVADRFTKPRLLAGTDCAYWRVEREAYGAPAVHEFAASDTPGPAPSPDAVHREKLDVEAPFPVEVDLRGLVSV